MKHYKYLFFDLDGTLANPSEGITKCIAYALSHFGITINDLQTSESWIGPPIKDSLRDVYGFDERSAELALQKYRERFSIIGIFENKLYDGVPAMLAELKQVGYTLHLATSKPTVYAEKILIHFGIDSFFDFVGGAALDDSRPTKAHVIQHVIDVTGLKDTDEALMIGDRKYDIIGGKKCGLHTAGVLHGFGDKTELEQAGADAIFCNLQELHSALKR